MGSKMQMKIDNFGKCSNNRDCNSGLCGYLTADKGAEQVCCPEGTFKKRYWGRTYCGRQPANTSCWSNKQCAGGKCVGNWFGLRRGQCNEAPSSPSAPVWPYQSTCPSGEMGYPSADPLVPAVCCPEYRTAITFNEKSYCDNIPHHLPCWKDEHCNSRYCRGNLNGTQRGTCAIKKVPFQSCSKNIECAFGKCGRSSHFEKGTVCCSENSKMVEKNGEWWCAEPEIASGT